MFKTFAKHSTESRKWYTLWAINFDGTPHTIDYDDDSWFVREVPAQFEFVEKAWKQYQWTGDKRYIEDDDLWQFYTKVLTDYIELHDDQDPNGIAFSKYKLTERIYLSGFFSKRNKIGRADQPFFWVLPSNKSLSFMDV